ncbi:YecR family lipoprotein [Herbaspirillum seropedicae]|uniref:YecR family lipoprotein n=1 Tax=Herbaspirillum seropedicae TaxID=964 RepID=UPI003D96A578
MKILWSIPFAVSLTLAGCATQKQLVPTGGSKADGTVKMSYEYGQFEVPKVNVIQGMSTAKRRCEAWGYSGAEPFGGSTRQCVENSGGGCKTWRVTYEFQCTGTKTQGADG